MDKEGDLHSERIGLTRINSGSKKPEVMRVHTGFFGHRWLIEWWSLSSLYIEESLIPENPSVVEEQERHQ